MLYKLVPFPLLFLAFLHLTQAQSPIYRVGQPVIDTLYEGIYGSSGNCTQIFDVLLGVDTVFFPYVTGVNLYLVLDSLDAPSSSVTTIEAGGVHSGDTLPLGDSIPTYTFTFFLGGNLNFQIIAAGVPQIPNEPYPCHFQPSITLGMCGNTYLIRPDSMYLPCLVDFANGLEEELIRSVRWGPNPAGDELHICWSAEQVQVQGGSLGNLEGKILSHFVVPVGSSSFDWELPDISSGVYFLSLSTSVGTIRKKLVVED